MQFLFQTDTSYILTRLLLQRGLALVYLIAFLVALRQFIPLLGEKGLLPVPLFLKRASFSESPSLFFLGYSDSVALLVFWLGTGLSLLALTGISERFGLPVSMLTWAILWILYLSIVNVGQTWYAFGWETMLLEAGFLAIFLGSRDVAPPVIVIWLYRWMLFRVILGAGLIKLRGDSCWRDLTCLNYHYETQPIPNPLSWFLHLSPEWNKKTGVFLTHVIQLGSPWLYFIPVSIVSAIGGGLTIGHQLLIALSGNLSFLNLLTIVIGFSTFDDRILGKILPPPIATLATSPPAFTFAVWGLLIGVLVLSIAPARNMLSSEQVMNTSFEPLHLVNTYGAFGSITRERYEIILEGTDDRVITPATAWKEYEFIAKPGSVARLPPIIAPWHLRLDWLMWFAAMSRAEYYPWIFNLVNHLLKNDPQTLSLMAGNPFPSQPPKFIRASLYLYKFTTPEERRKTGNWWKRTYDGVYLPPLSLSDEAFRELLKEQGW